VTLEVGVCVREVLVVGGGAGALGSWGCGGGGGGGLRALGGGGGGTRARCMLTQYWCPGVGVGCGEGLLLRV